MAEARGTERRVEHDGEIGAGLPRRRAWKRTRFFLLGVVLIVIALFARVLVCSWLPTFSGYHRAEFDSARWRSGWSCRCTPLRMQMAESLLAEHDLRGRTREQVRELLGEPDEGAYVAPSLPPGTFLYHLAPSPHWLDDNCWLVVAFGEAGTVSKASIEVD